MAHRTIQIELPSVAFSGKACGKGAWLVLLHARRVPPHAGMIIDGIYNSLTIKGHELNVPKDALAKTVARRNIEAVFIKLSTQPVFSMAFQNEVFMDIIKKENPVTPNGSTCLTPIKLFFREFYGLPLLENELLYNFIVRLKDNKFVDYFSACNFEAEEGILELPYYSAAELKERILNERLPFYNN